MASMYTFQTGLIIVIFLTATCFANKKTLVLVDNWAVRETHSIYFRSLRGKSPLNYWLKFIPIRTTDFRPSPRVVAYIDSDP